MSCVHMANAVTVAHPTVAIGTAAIVLGGVESITLKVLLLPKMRVMEAMVSPVIAIATLWHHGRRS